jgi:hypothetical protein
MHPRRIQKGRAPDTSRLPQKSTVEDALNFGMRAVADIAAVSLPCG